MGRWLVLGDGEGYDDLALAADLARRLHPPARGPVAEPRPVPAPDLLPRPLDPVAVEVEQPAPPGVEVRRCGLRRGAEEVSCHLVLTHLVGDLPVAFPRGTVIDVGPPPDHGFASDAQMAGALLHQHVGDAIAHVVVGGGSVDVWGSDDPSGSRDASVGEASARIVEVVGGLERSYGLRWILDAGLLTAAQLDRALAAPGGYQPGGDVSTVRATVETPLGPRRAVISWVHRLRPSGPFRAAVDPDRVVIDVDGAPELAPLRDELLRWVHPMSPPGAPPPPHQVPTEHVGSRWEATRDLVVGWMDVTDLPARRAEPDAALRSLLSGSAPRRPRR